MKDKVNKIGPDSTFSDKVMFGLNIAIRKMAEEAALHDESLVIGDIDGNVKWIPAKDLLKDLPE